MQSETFWSSESSSPMQNNGGVKYRSMLDSVDSEVAKLLSGSAKDGLNSLGGDIGRRISFNDGSDIDSDLFGVKKGALSAITAPVGGPSRPQIYGGTASVTAGIANRHPQSDSFFQKFASVADATRDIELSNNFARISLESSSRRTSVNGNEPGNGMKALNESGFFGSQSNSLNENLNIPISKTSRKQSISEKIDNYNSSSPIQNSAVLSVTSDLNSNGLDKNPEVKNNTIPHNFWNPAKSMSFTPTNSYNYFVDGNAPVHQGSAGYFYGKGATANVIPSNLTPPPFDGPAPPANFMDLGFVGFGGYPQVYPDTTDDPSSSKNEASSESTGDADEIKDPVKNSMSPGVGYVNRSIGSNPVFMFPPFQSYPMYQVPTPPQAPVSNTPTRDKHPQEQNGTPAQSFQKKKANTKANSSSKGGNHIYRSPLLEEVRSNSKAKEYFLKDIYGHGVEFTKDQHGSRFIQQKLPDASEEEKEVIFNEIRDLAYELMTDVFGNYVIQKYFELGSNAQKKVLLESMTGNIYKLSLQMYGCRVVQRALEFIDTESQIKIIEELKDYILICSKDQNGNHVIQKSIERIPFENIRFFLESLDSQIYHLSTHPYGCRVIQRLLEYSTPEDQKNILNELNRFIFYLIQDQYGNYVMQHTLERGNPEDKEEILKVVLGSVINFSKHKFASNVIEKCIKFGSLEQRRKVLHEVMIGNEDYEVTMVDDDSPLALMMKDQYANYVIQKLVEGFDAKSEEKRLLVTKLRQYLKQISSKNSYGKHLASVEKMIIVAESALIEADNGSD